MTTPNISWTEADLRAAHKASSLPVPLIRESAKVGCFYCLTVFPSSELIENTDTAWCPYCGIDSVLPEREVPDIHIPGFLKGMSAFWFLEERSA
jgi:uncharacterized Zn-finger protein